MYKCLPNLVIGFHGCDIEAYKNVLYKHKNLEPSNNPHDWLGNGIYFWENSYERAYEWAMSHCKSQPAVIGAVINLGYCLNLADYGVVDELKLGYQILKLECKLTGTKLPENRNTKNDTDLLIRELDCAVIQRIHKYHRDSDNRAYDSVRGVFLEGKEVYDNSGFRKKTHTQLSIINPNCIKGYFAPREFDSMYERI